MKVIAVANNKGGVAKTTTAGNLAYGLSRLLIKDGVVTGRVLAIDLDPQGNLADFFGVRKMVGDRCIGEVLAGRQSLKQAVMPVDREDEGLPRPNLFLIPASSALESSTQELVLRQLLPAYRDQFDLDTVLRDALSPLLSHFQYVVIDCPPKLDVLKRAVYNLADEVVVPVKADHISLIGARQHTTDLVKLKEGKNGRKFPARLVAILPTMVQPRQVLARETIAVMKRYYRDLVMDPVPDSVVVKESPATGGRTLFEYAPESPPAIAYLNLVRRLA
jgi:chromosome partitioning protein